MSYQIFSFVFCVVFTFILLMVFKKSQQEIQKTAKVLVDPNDKGTRIYSLGSSFASNDNVTFSIVVMAGASIFLGTSILFVYELFSQPIELWNFVDSPEFWIRVLLTCGFIFVLLLAWSLFKNMSRKKSRNREIITSEVRVEFSSFLELRPFHTFILMLRGKPYIEICWSDVLDWRVLKTWYPMSTGGIWVQEYRISTNNQSHVISRAPLLGLEEQFLEDVRTRIADKLKIEDSFVAAP